MPKTTMAVKLEAILAAGRSQRSIAKEVGCDISTIYRIRTGLIPDPRYSIGHEIDRLYESVSTAAA